MQACFDAFPDSQLSVSAAAVSFSDSLAHSSDVITLHACRICSSTSIDLSPHSLSNLALPPHRPLEPILARPIVHHSLPHLPLGSDDKRTILHDRLVERLASDEDEVSVFRSVKVVWSTKTNPGLAGLGGEDEGVEFGVDSGIGVDLEGAFDDWESATATS